MKSEKITENKPGHRRRYLDACGTAHALELVGERWALLVMRELMLGPRRFNDLKQSLPGISANVLTQRLEGLEAAGILRQRRMPSVNVMAYELTEWGYEGEPIFQVLGRWAVRSPSHDRTLPLSLASLILSMRTMFDAEAAGGFKARIGLRVGEDTFLARVKKGRFTIARGDLAEAEAIVAGRPAGIAAAIYSGRPLAELEADGTVTASGDREALQRFLRLFTLPPRLDEGRPSA